MNKNFINFQTQQEQKIDQRPTEMIDEAATERLRGKKKEKKKRFEGIAEKLNVFPNCICFGKKIKKKDEPLVPIQNTC